MSDSRRVDDPSWEFAIRFAEDDERTTAVVTLKTATRRLEARGSARRNPVDPNVPQVGEDLAAARALSRLAHDLLDDAITQFHTVSAEPAGIRL